MKSSKNPGNRVLATNIERVLAEGKPVDQVLAELRRQNRVWELSGDRLTLVGPNLNEELAPLTTATITRSGVDSFLAEAAKRTPGYPIAAGTDWNEIRPGSQPR